MSNMTSHDTEELSAEIQVLTVKFDGLAKMLEQAIDRLEKSIHRVEQQTTLTNGRTTKLEKWQIEQMSRDAHQAAESARNVESDRRRSDIRRAWLQPLIVGILVGLFVGAAMLEIGILLGTNG